MAQIKEKGMTRKIDVDPEFNAMRAVYDALKDLNADAQKRVLDYVLRRLSFDTGEVSDERSGSTFSPAEPARETERATEAVSATASTPASDEEFEGVSPVAQRWIRRNGLTVEQLSKPFTLGVDDIDLIARRVPGKTKKDKMRSVALLSGVAEYRGSGAARITHEALKEALGDYDAYDVNNFSSYMKDLAGEISGSRESGYNLTARGLAAAAELVNELTGSKQS